MLIGNANNAHRPHAFDVEDVLVRSGENTLVVTIHPTIPVVRVVAGAYPYKLPFSRYPGSLAQYNVVRKPATDFGWSFTSAIMPHGILRNVTLESRNYATITAAGLSQTHHSNGTVDLAIDAVVLPPANETESGIVSLTITHPNGTVVVNQQATVQPFDLTTASCLAVSLADPNVALAGNGLCTLQSPITDDTVPRSALLQVSLPLADVYNWHTYELGVSPMYTVNVTYAADGAGAEGVSSFVSSMGLRSAQIVMEEVLNVNRSVVGSTYRHTINGQQFYARGGSVVPVEILDARVADGREAALVDAAVDKNMNALRVWGGGRYMREEFYDAADSAGLAIFQDAMFTSAMYPVDEDFLAEVRLEVAYQLGRLSWHPSVVSWSGSAANEASMNWLAITGWSVVRFSNDLSALSVATIRDTLVAADPLVAYIDTNPSNGVLSTAPYVKRWGNTTNASFGDILTYDWEEDAFDDATYPEARFVTEFGIQSWPSYNVYQRSVGPGDLGLRRPMSADRTRITNGRDYVAAQMGRHFTTASDTTGLALNNTIDPVGLRAFAHVSQIQQAQAFRTAAAKWRAGKVDGTLTAGLMQFQLNDMWSCLSWASIDANGQYKLAFHAAKDALAPVGAALRNDGDTISVTLLNDLAVDVAGSLIVQAVPYQATAASQVVSLASIPSVTVPKLSGRQNVWSATVAAVTNAASPRTHYIEYVWCPVANANVPSRVPFTCSSGSITLAEFKDSTLGAPNVTVAVNEATAESLADGTLILDVSSEGGVALFVSLLAGDDLDGNFNTTGFHLKPWEPVTVEFDLTRVARANAINSTLSVTAADLVDGLIIDYLQYSLPYLKRTSI